MTKRLGALICLVASSFQIMTAGAFINHLKAAEWNFIHRNSLPSPGMPKQLYMSAVEPLTTNTSTSANPRGVDRVSICHGELCKCQEEENAETIMNDLISRDLPYVVEDAPCLGACGVGAMVSIEYEDGGYDLVTGLQETHIAVGILSSPTSSKPPVPAIADPVLEIQQKADFISNDEDEIIEESQPITMATSLDSQPIKDSAKEDHGAVQRMRDQAKAAKNEEKPNPWVNMALYLAKKAQESVTGG